MKKCLKLSIIGKFNATNFSAYIKDQVEKLEGLEGTLQKMVDESLVVHILGPTETVDKLIDIIYKGNGKDKVDFIANEALVGNNKEFRGVFRIIG